MPVSEKFDSLEDIEESYPLTSPDSESPPVSYRKLYPDTAEAHKVQLPDEKEKDLSLPSAESGSSTDLKPRENYANGIDFLMACLGFGIGLGNVWRFPYLCYRNGGGAFLIPYIVCIVLAGFPAYFMEVVLGQFMQRGGMEAWKICPLFYGLGHCTTVIVFIINLYYIVILTWSFFYLFASLTKNLPWDSCDNWWNTDRCYLSKMDDNLSVNSTLVNGTATNVTYAVGSIANATLANATRKGRIDPTVEYWENRVLSISDDIGTMGTIKWDLALCLLLAWVVCYLCIFKGIKASGKVLYVVVPLPYVLMIILFIRGVTLPGSLDGITYYLVPEWSRLKDPQVWVDAGTQILFAYSLGQGVLVALGSYNTTKHNIMRDASIFACASSFTSLFSGFVIFSVLGFMAQEQGVHISKVAEEGPGLAFIAYPKAISLMPVAPLWSILFFLMLILLGIDSEFVGIEGFVTAIVDLFPRQMRRPYRREIFLAVQSVISFFAGLFMVTNGGMYVFQLFDYYAGSRIILLIILCEIIAAIYVFGVRRMFETMEMMFGFQTPCCVWYMKIGWCFTAPIYCLVLFVQGAMTYTELSYERPTKTYTYPSWGIAIGWMIALSSVVCIPIVMVYQIATTKGALLERVRYLLKPQLRRDQLLPHEQNLSKDQLSAKGITLVVNQYSSADGVLV